MGRKKKEQNNGALATGAAEGKLKINIASDVKRSAVAIILFALALVIILGFFGVAGVAGNSLDSITGQILGWAKLVFPIFLIIGGVILLLRKETSFYVAKLIGLTLILVSLTGFFHWFYDTNQMLSIAKHGKGGGYVGYGIVYLLAKYLGSAGSLVVIFATLFIGIIVAFDFSIIHFIAKFKREEREEGDIQVVEENNASAEIEIEDGKKETENLEDEKQQQDDLKNNIGKIEFVEGSDQFISPKIENSKKAGKKNIVSLQTKMNTKGERWNFPPLSLLERSSGTAKGGDTESNAEIIERTLRNFGIEVERGEILTGPAVTQYSFRPAIGVKIAKILSLQNDLALALAAHPIRIEAPIPGKSLIGIEVPNKVSAMVRLREIIEDQEFQQRSSGLTLALGKDVSGSYIFGDLTKMPHLMIAGATGTGKSVGINSIITTLLYQNSPDELKFILVDPKRVELSLYNGIPHLLTDVIVDNGKVVNALKWAVGEMERRYRLLQDAGSRDLNSYREKMKTGKKRQVTDPETGEVAEEEMEYLPYIVILIDELADLMGSHGKEVEGAIVRIAQMARAVGIHLILSTQRPSVEVITGLIKANVTTRIAFQVATQIDSRTILDMGGAEKLLGNGDMLFLSSASPKPKRIQGVFVSEAEVKSIVKFIKGQKVEDQSIGEEIVSSEKSPVFEFKNDSSGSDVDDDMYESAKAEVIRAGKASASLLQRRLRVGYARAARLLDILEDKGVVGPSDGAKPREVYAAEKKETIAYDDTVSDQEKRDKWEM